MRFCSRLIFFVVLISLSLPGLFAQTLTASAPLELRSGVPFVRITINGRGPYTFVVDTGTSSEAVVSPRLVKDLQLPAVGQKRMTDVGGSSFRYVPEVSIASLNLGGETFSEVHAIVSAPLANCGGYDGILGFALFRNTMLTLDYPHKRLELSNASLSLQQGAHPLALRQGVPVTHIQYGTTMLEAQIDTGGLGIDLPVSLAPEVKFVAGTRTAGAERTMVSGYTLHGGQLQGSIQFDKYLFAKPYVVLNPVFPIANIGALGLQGFVLRFDQRNLLESIESPDPIHKVAPSPMLVADETFTASYNPFSHPQGF